MSCHELFNTQTLPIVLVATIERARTHLSTYQSWFTCRCCRLPKPSIFYTPGGRLWCTGALATREAHCVHIFIYLMLCMFMCVFMIGLYVHVFVCVYAIRCLSCLFQCVDICPKRTRGWLGLVSPVFANSWDVCISSFLTYLICSYGLVI